MASGELTAAVAPFAEAPATAASRPLERRSVTAAMADYVALTKPRVIELLLVTTVPPMFLAAGGWPGAWLIAATLIGGTLTAGAANAMNMVRDRDIDARMLRTRQRPLPAGRITPRSAMLFGAVLGIAGPTWLWITVGSLPAALTAAAMAFYVGVYSWWLKRTTVHNIVIGGAAGAVPVLVGWAAVSGTVGAGAWVLFMIVFLWTPPHFWALAIVCDRDYAAASVPMLPVVHGRHETARRSLRYAVATVACSLLLPLADARIGVVYIAAAIVLGAILGHRAVNLARRSSPPVARRLFRYSIQYLALLFTAVIVDQLLPWPGS
ncbi:MAG TPA: heme o synthase [Euzebyales bacterium]|nr:heme o synthase [Euzebyales bacterium]